MGTEEPFVNIFLRRLTLDGLCFLGWMSELIGASKS